MATEETCQPPRYVLELLVAKVLRVDTRLVANFVVSVFGDADRTWPGEFVYPRCDVDAVTANRLIREQHVAEVNADAKFQIGVVLGARLHRSGTVHRVDGAVKAAYGYRNSTQAPKSGRKKKRCRLLSRSRTEAMARNVLVSRSNHCPKRKLLRLPCLSCGKEIDGKHYSFCNACLEPV